MAIRKFHIEFLDGTPFSPSQVVSPSRVWDYQSSLVTLGTMTSADFLPYLYRVRISPGKSLFFHLIPAASTDGSLLVKALCKDVLAYPLLTASVCRSCSSVPDFVVSLSSVLQLLTATLRLTNTNLTLRCRSILGGDWLKVKAQNAGIAQLRRVFATQRLSQSTLRYAAIVN